MDVGVLGSVEVWLDGERLPVGAPLQRCVLATLALHAGEGVPVERLIDILWGEHAPTDARGLVQGYVSRLRKVLRPAGIQIMRRPPGYALDVEREQVDVHVFRALAAKARAAASAEDLAEAARRLAEALGLWRGEPLAGVAGSDVLARVQAGLAEERLTASEELLELKLRLGQHRESLGELTALAAEHPLREKLVGLAMVALYRSGRRAEALERYQETRLVLAEQLGLDPGDELRALHEQMLRAEVEPVAAPQDGGATARRRPSSLPFDVPDFTGRSRELALLLGELPTDGGAVISAIDGMAGAGKTALAVHAARRVAQRYPDAQLFIDLHGFTPGREPVAPATALDTLLRSVGVAADRIPADFDQRVLAWRTELADRRAVIVLDNAADAAQVRPLIPGSPGCLVLVTSRRRMPTIDGAIPLSLDVLPADEAAALFATIVGERARSEPTAVAELVEQCGRLPLAIRIASTRLQHRPQWTVVDLVERLRTEQVRLSELAADDRDMTAAFTVSYRHLEPDQQRMFRLLGAHPGVDFDAYATAAIAGVGVAEAQCLLEVLLDHHLLEQQVRSRYTFHDLLRHHALTLIAADPQRPAATRRLLDYYLFVASQAADLLQPGRRRIGERVAHAPADVPLLPDNQAAMGWYAAEHHNLIALSRHAVVHGLDEHACQLPREVGHYLVIGHHVEDLVAVQEPAADAARRLGDPLAESLSVYHLALTYYMACRYRLGLDHAGRNLTLARELGDASGEGYTLAVIGLLHYRLGNYNEALDNHRAALAIMETLGDHRGSAICVANIGRTELILGRLDSAHLLLEDALARCRKLGERNEEASNLTTLGTINSRLDRPAAAITSLRAGLALARELGNADYTIRGLIELADGLRRAGLLAEAHGQARQALDLLDHGRSPDHLAEANNVLGAICFERGDQHAAFDHHRRALVLAQRIEYRMEIATALRGIAVALDQLGDPAGAREHWQQALAHYSIMAVPQASRVREHWNLDAAERHAVLASGVSHELPRT